MLQAWHTLLQLKDNHKRLGAKGRIYFIIDFPMNIETEEMLFMIGPPTFTGVGVTSGLFSYVLNKEQLNELFNVMDKTFREHEEELTKNYFNSVVNKPN